MGFILAILFLALAIAGVIGLIRPRRVRVPNRWWAGVLLSSAILPVGAAVQFDPAPGQRADQYGLVTSLALWATVVLVLWIARHSIASYRKGAAQQRAYRHTQPVLPVPIGSPTPSLEEEMASIRRMASSTRRTRAPRSLLPKADDTGALATFTYADVDGVVTDRVVLQWICDGTYVRGYCQMRRDSRTFRLDRIERWVA